MFNRTYTFISFSAFYATYTALLGPARLLFLGKNCYLHIYLGSTIIKQVKVILFRESWNRSELKSLPFLFQGFLNRRSLLYKSHEIVPNTRSLVIRNLKNAIKAEKHKYTPYNDGPPKTSTCHDLGKISQLKLPLLTLCHNLL